MNMLFLGNGFDLWHCLPTKYENFLHTVDFLQKNLDESIDTVGKVFGNKTLQEQDKFIKNSYEKYTEIYDSIPLEKEKIREIIEMSKKNMWFSYLLKSFNKDLGWIDFEREIAKVIEVFNMFFETEFLKNSFFIPHGSRCEFIIKEFNFFYTERKGNFVVLGNYNGEIKYDYMIENPFSSGIFEVNKEKIIEEMENHLKELSKILKLYLECFIESLTDKLEGMEKISKISIANDVDYVFSMNYTKTFEKIYDSANIFHIHGEVDREIVLGVNADETDEIENLNKNFIAFKKYYQRTFYKTDHEYQRALINVEKNNKYDNGNRLYVIGHSLDITDKEIIMELFERSSEVVILCHNQSARSNYIKNLVSIYGKSGFDRIRTEKELDFLPL